jgi:hypothetical protein
MQTFRRPGELESPHHGTGKFANIDHSTAQIMSQRSSPWAAGSIQFTTDSDNEISQLSVTPQ